MPKLTPSEPRKKPGPPKGTRYGGRQTSYDPEVARIICERLSEGIPLRQICREGNNFPAWRTVYDWMAQDAELAAAIAHARDLGYDAIAEDCLRIADEQAMGEIVTEDEAGKRTVRREDMLGHRKLRIETRLKLLAKFNPKKYGDRMAVEGVEGGAPIKTEDATFEKLQAILSNMELKKRAGE